MRTLVLQSVHINFAKEDCVCVCKKKSRDDVVPLPLLCSGITNEDTIYEIFNISETVVLRSYVQNVNYPVIKNKVSSLMYGLKLVSSRNPLKASAYTNRRLLHVHV